MKIIQPRTNFSKEITIPSSKSEVQRIIACASLFCAETRIYNIDYCKDIEDAIFLAKQFGAEIKSESEYLQIKGNLRNSKDNINCGESGLSTRVFSSFALLFDKVMAFNGTGSILNREMTEVISFFETYGKCLSHNNYKLPYKLKGRLKSKIIELDCSETSQFLSGLLITIPHLNIDSIIRVFNLKSKPYIDLTISILKNFGIEVCHENYEEFSFKKIFCYEGTEFYPEGDWSNAAFFAVAGAIGGKSVLKNLRKPSAQGDSIILKILEQVGVAITFSDENIIIRKSELTNFDFDATDYPDMFPPLAILACHCTDYCRIKGIHRLENKESNRVNSIISMLTKFGIKTKKENDYLYIFPNKIVGGEIDSFNDHRIVMASTIASINASGEIRIVNAEAVLKSYPRFFSDFYK